jgi:hypothetical protein
MVPQRKHANNHFNWGRPTPVHGRPGIISGRPFFFWRWCSMRPDRSFGAERGTQPLLFAYARIVLLRNRRSSPLILGVIQIGLVHFLRVLL